VSSAPHSHQRIGWTWLVIAAAALAAIPAAHAGPAATGTSDHVAVRLFSAVQGTGTLKTLPVGLEVKLDEGWKTYWRSPGDAGLPPALDWTGSTNLAGATLLYPAPTRITVLGIQTFGYKHEVVFPLDLTLARPGEPLDMRLKLDLLVCAEQCVPKTFDLALVVPAGTASPGPDTQLLAKARAAVPSDSRTSGLTVTGAQEVSDKGAAALEVTIIADRQLSAPDVIPEVKPDAALGPPRFDLAPDKRGATFVIPLPRKLPVGAKLTGREVTLTVTDGDRALETTRPITPGASAVEEEPGPTLATMLAVALLGGLILNLMPCVLPVLSLKFLSVIGQGGRATRAVRAGFLATAAGIVVSFLVIAIALIAVKAAGRSIGWGLQFQEPAFVAGMAVLVTIFACHLAGLFEMPLPRFIRAAASTRTAPDDSLAGHFVTGAFATLLATPCSAPFLGTAVGFALAGGIVDMLAIFTALGAGLALPYLVIAAVPRLASKMPRPGKWMAILRQAMAIPLVGTAVWLLSVLANQVGRGPAFGIALLLVAIAALLFWRDKLPATRRGFVLPAVVVLALGTAALPDVIAARIGTDRATDSDRIAWTSFDRDKIRSLLSQGKTIFVDVTADWCLTCKANARFVLAQEDVAKRLNTQAVSMRADWTRPDAEIGAYLGSYGRYGIPFNIVYGPGAPSGIVLPELLTPGDVRAALDKASKVKAASL
jgi:suppressor for copper-sensitivity B